jgi:DNA-binding transcriptional LysR family regulator
VRAAKAKAAVRLARSTSAISAQLRKLEDQVGEPLLRRSGRGLALTETGETLLAYARRMLELNDQAAAAVRRPEPAGSVRLGMPEDFGEALLPHVLGAFARAHPKVRVEARVARNAELADKVGSGHLDLALVWEAGTPLRYSRHIADVPMRWIGPGGVYEG